MGTTDNTTADTARSILTSLNDQSNGSSNKNKTLKAPSYLDAGRSRNVALSPKTPELDNTVRHSQKPSFDIADQGFTPRPRPTRITRIAETPVIKPPIQHSPVMPADEANSAENAKLRAQQLARANRKARQRAVAAQDLADQRARLEKREARKRRRQLDARTKQQKAQKAEATEKLAIALLKSIQQTLQNPSAPSAGESQDEGGHNMRERADNNTTAPISDEAFQSNQRLATALSKRNGVGDLPKFTADAINRDGKKALSEFVNLIGQVRENDLEQAQELFDKTMQGIEPVRQKELWDTYAFVQSNDNAGRRTLEQSTEEAFGLEEDIDRPKGILPMPDKIDPDGKDVENIDWSNWTAPEWVYEGAKAITLPKHVLDGGKWSPEDVTKAALSMNVGSSVSSVPAGALRSGVTRLRGTPKFMRKVDLEKQGQDAAKKAMDTKASVPQAMFREDVGEITFDYGSPRLGLEHIRSGRMQKDGMSEEEAMAFIQQKVPEILAHGKLAKHTDKKVGRRAEITYKNNRVILALNRSGNRETWVITGYEDW